MEGEGEGEGDGGEKADLYAATVRSQAVAGAGGGGHTVQRAEMGQGPRLQPPSEPLSHSRAAVWTWRPAQGPGVPTGRDHPTFVSIFQERVTPSESQVPRGPCPPGPQAGVTLASRPQPPPASLGLGRGGHGPPALMEAACHSNCVTLWSHSWRGPDRAGSGHRVQGQAASHVEWPVCWSPSPRKEPCCGPGGGDGPPTGGWRWVAGVTPPAGPARRAASPPG